VADKYALLKRDKQINIVRAFTRRTRLSFLLHWHYNKQNRWYPAVTRAPPEVHTDAQRYSQVRPWLEYYTRNRACVFTSGACLRERGRCTGWGGGAEERERKRESETVLNFVYGFTFSAFQRQTLALARNACGDSVSEGEHEHEDEDEFREKEI